MQRQHARTKPSALLLLRSVTRSEARLRCAVGDRRSCGRRGDSLRAHGAMHSDIDACACCSVVDSARVVGGAPEAVPQRPVAVIASQSSVGAPQPPLIADSDAARSSALTDSSACASAIQSVAALLQWIRGGCGSAVRLRAAPPVSGCRSQRGAAGRNGEFECTRDVSVCVSMALCAALASLCRRLARRSTADGGVDGGSAAQRRADQ